MIRGLLAAIAFLTRLPVSSKPSFSTGEVGGSARWFPLVGLAIGFAYVIAADAAASLFPALIAGLIVVLVEALLTGALHMDGLADMADGFGGGDTREDVLRIMRDHAIGTYGAVSLILLIALKAAAISVLIQTSKPDYLVLAPALGRWSAVFMAVLQPYAREGTAVSKSIGGSELMIATILAALPTGILFRWNGIALGFVSAGITAAISAYCKHRIGGITGDTMGANCEIVEVAILLMGAAARDQR
jgi:adenosylcobinamide-GDP ribazoletransferase